MPTTALEIGVILASYLIGSFPTGVVLTKRKYKIDVREIGSGNIGATNVLRVFGWHAGLLTLVLDVLKGAIPLWWIHSNYSDRPWLCAFSGIALVLGHCFSVYLKFKGGKGVATSLGVLLIVQPWAAGLGLLSYLFLFLITKISAVGSLAALVSVVLYNGMTPSSKPIQTMLFSICIIVLVRHFSNIRRLVQGKEKKL